jgi:hypothetical protein
MSEDSKPLVYHSCSSGNTQNHSDSSPSNFSNDVAVPVFNTPSYIKSIKRRGNVYMVDESESFNPVDQMITDLYNEILAMALEANKKAKMLKLFNGLSNIFLVISGSVIGVLTLNEENNSSYYYVSSILGFGITGVQTLMAMFSVEKRGIVLKDVSSTLRKISRQVKNLSNSNMNLKDKRKKLEYYYAKIDQLDLIIFDNSATAIPKNRNDDQTTSSDSSDIQRRVAKPRGQVIVEMNT